MYRICIAPYPTAIVHYSSVATLISSMIRDSGFDCEISWPENSLDFSSNYTLIYLSDQALKLPSLPENTILVNLGPLDDRINSEYLRSLRKYRIWDYSSQNQRKLQKYGINCELISLGYHTSLKSLQCTEDIDVLFYGQMSEAYQKLQENLQSRGYHVVSSHYDDKLVLRAKIVVLLDWSDVISLNLLLMNEKCVILEKSSSDRKYPVIQCAYENMSEMISQYLEDEEGRRHECAQNFEIYSKMQTSLPELKEDTRTWTIVTAYFNLKKEKDSNCEVRDKSLYFEECKYLMECRRFMVIFCDKESYPYIWRLRYNFGLLDQTYFIIQELSDFPLYQYRDRIEENRRGNSFYVNHRNTPSYFVLVTSKFTMLKETVKLNPFQTTNFVFIDFGIRHTGVNDIQAIDRALSGQTKRNRDKVGVCWIDYTPEAIMRNNKEYYSHGRCGIAGGFISGNAKYLNLICNEVEKRFKETVEAGYGHAEEQFLPLIYLDHPEWFSVFFGDYGQMITNAGQMRQNPLITLNLLIPKARQDNKNDIAFQGCQWILDGWDKETITLSGQELCRLYEETFISAWWTKRTEHCKSIVKRFECAWEDEKYHEIVKANLRRYVEVTDYIKLLEPQQEKKIIQVQRELKKEENPFWTANPIYRNF